MSVKPRTSRRKAADKPALPRSTRSTVRTDGGDNPQSQRAFTLPDDVVEEALRTGDQPGLLEELFGPAGYVELRALARQTAARSVRGGKRVMILPGIMGSKLGYARTLLDDMLWFDPIDIAAGRLGELALGSARSRSISAVGVILFAYLKLKLKLRITGHDAEFWPYDWRLGLADLGQKLAHDINGGGRPTQLVAHSMGGLVARAALAHDIKGLERVVTLGTPNFGSYSPVQAFRGVHSIVRKVAFLDLKHGEADLAGIFGTFPGLIEMMPKPQFRLNDLFEPKSWPEGTRPGDAMLKAARTAQEALPLPNEKFILVVGTGTSTVVNARLEGTKEFLYDISPDGDGTVPLDLARIVGRPTYRTNAEHGGMPNDNTVAAAVDNLLATGKTSVLELLDEAAPARRSAVTRTVREMALKAAQTYEGKRGRALSASETRRLIEEVAAPPHRDEAQLPALLTLDRVPVTAGAQASTELELLQGYVVTRQRRRRLDIELVCGSITETFADSYVVGMFSNVRPDGAAAAVDRELNGALGELVARRMFGGDVGEVSAIPMGRHRLGAASVMVAGLGTFAGFSEESLQLVAENVMRTALLARLDDFAVVPMGASSGIPPASVLRQMLQGFLRALAAIPDGRIRGFSVCEMDAERFQVLRAAFHTLLRTDLFGEVEITLTERRLPPPAPATSTRALAAGGPQSVYLWVRHEVDGAGKANVDAAVLTSGGKASIYRGRQPLKPGALEALAKRLADTGLEAGEVAKFGRDVAAMALESGIQDILERELRGDSSGTARSLVVVHDGPLSRVPWETLHINEFAPALAGGLTHRYDGRGLSVAKWRDERVKTPGLDVLLVVNPTEDLVGAKDEGERIQKMFTGRPDVRIRTLYGAEARRSELLDCFRSGRFDVVHYAGHAFFDPDDVSRSGILCHGKEVLSGADLAGLSQLPSLVFFNACEAAKIRRVGQTEQATTDPVRGTTSFAESFLSGGVANYLGTYWPVGDAAAKTFAETFYGALLKNEPLGRALLSGRQAVENLKSGDWANYVLYGSPDFLLKSAE